MDERTDGRRRGPPQKSSSGLCPERRANDQGAICGGIIYAGGGYEGLQAIFIIIGRGLAPAARHPPAPTPMSYSYHGSSVWMVAIYRHIATHIELPVW